MVNTTKGGDEGTPKNTERRKFLIGMGLTTIASAATMLGVTKCKETISDRHAEILGNTDIVDKIKNFDSSMNIATENLFDAYESLEFDVAKKYFTDNYINADANKLINLSVMIMHLENVGILNNVIQKKKDNMLFKFMNESHGNRSTIESTISYSNYLFAKKYPQLVPVIEEWKKKNGK